MRPLSESDLHRQLKAMYGGHPENTEIPVMGYRVDVRHPDHVVEIQTQNLFKLKSKLLRLLPHVPVVLVYPLVASRIVLQLGSGRRRKSPRRARLLDAFDELVSLSHIFGHPNLTLEVLLIEELEERTAPRRRTSRFRVNRQLLGVLERHTFKTPDDFRRLIPPELEMPFSPKTLAGSWGLPHWHASRACYFLHHIGLLERTGRTREGYIYQWHAAPPGPPCEAELPEDEELRDWEWIR